MSSLVSFIINKIAHKKDTKTFLIVGKLNIRAPLRIDRVVGEKRADYLVCEYRKVFGRDWEIYKQPVPLR